MTDFRTELRKMKKHRERYLPAIEALLRAGKPGSGTAFPMEIGDPDRMRIVMELIDLGYLDEDSFRITKSFGSVTGLAYRGTYPLTTDGDEAFAALKKARKSKRFVMAAISALLVTAGAAAALLFLTRH